MRDRALREDPPRHPHLPDLRGRQRRDARVRRPLGDQAGRREALGARRDRARRPDRLDRRAGRLRRRPDPAPGRARTGSRRPTRSSQRHARRGLRPGRGAPRRRPRRCCASTRAGSSTRQFQQKRLSDAVADIYAQIAVLSRVTAIFEDQGVEPSGQERYIADTFCARAADRVRSNFDQVEHNDDERIVGDRQARLQARRVRLRAVRGLTPEPSVRISRQLRRSAAGGSHPRSRDENEVDRCADRRARARG